MDVSVESTGTLSRKLKVQIPAREIDEKVDGRIREMGQHVRLKGFRPGRVPFKVLQQRFGRQVRQEVVGQVIQESFQQAVSQEKLRPASMPEIAADDPASGKDLAYTASFEVLPEIDELEVGDLAVEKPVASVSESDVDEMIQTLREQRRSWEDKDGPAEEGDLAFFSYRVECDDGTTFPEGEEPARAGAALGHGGFDEAFEERLVGLEAGATAEFTHTFADQARERQLAGRSGKVSLAVEKVQAVTLPEVDEAFMASFGVTEGGMEQFRAEVRENLERELKQALSRAVRRNVIDALIAAHEGLEVPAALVDRECASLRQQAQAQLQQMGADPQAVPPEASFREEAERRVRGALLVSEVARHGALEVDLGRVRDRVNEIASTYDDPQAVVQAYYQREDLIGGVQNIVLEEQAVDWVLERAKVTEVDRTFAQVMHPEKAGAEPA